MRDLFRLIGWTVVDLFRSRAALEAEIWTLRQQINVLRRTAPKRFLFSVFDRLVFAGLYRLFPKICDALAIVKPDTIVRWHRAGFRSYWRWKSRPRGGRPTVPLELRRLVREMSIANPLWGAPRPRRASQARHRYRPDQRSQVYGQASRPAVPRLENLYPQSCRWHRGDGSVRRSDDLVSFALRLVDHGARPAADSMVWSHRIRPRNGSQISSRKHAAGIKFPAI